MEHFDPLSRSLPARLHGSHQTRINQTLQLVRKWARFENARPEFGGFPPLKRGVQNCLFSDVLQRHRELSLIPNIFGKKRDRQTKQDLSTRKDLDILPIFGELCGPKWLH